MWSVTPIKHATEARDEEIKKHYHNTSFIYTTMEVYCQADIKIKIRHMNKFTSLHCSTLVIFVCHHVALKVDDQGL